MSHGLVDCGKGGRDGWHGSWMGQDGSSPAALHESNKLGTWAKLGGDMQVWIPSLEYLVAPCGVDANACRANDVALAQ